MKKDEKYLLDVVSIIKQHDSETAKEFKVNIEQSKNSDDIENCYKDIEKYVNSLDKNSDTREDITVKIKIIQNHKYGIK